jgi:ribosomal protein S18 acetylase RimI-like enzyme
MIRIRAMTSTDLPLGLGLTEQAGWNQTEADWRRFLDLQPDGCFVAELDGAAVGTTTTCLFGPVAWVAMVLVDTATRGRGVGSALLAHALGFLDSAGVRTVRLDATPLGQPLYEKLGFEVQYQVARYDGVPRGGLPVPEAAPIRDDESGAVAQLDRAVTGTDRGKLLARLIAESATAVRCGTLGRADVGFLLARPGARAVQIGPCVAGPEAGPMLLAAAWNRFRGQRVFMDVPVANTAAVRLAEAQGLSVQRSLVRMCRGEWVEERVPWLWASSGPEMG